MNKFWISIFIGIELLGIVFGIVSIIVAIISWVNYLVKDEPFYWSSIWGLAISSISVTVAIIGLGFIKYRQSNSRHNKRLDITKSEVDRYIENWARNRKIAEEAAMKMRENKKADSN